MISKDRYGKHYVVRISLDKTHDSLIADKCAHIVKALGLMPTRLYWGNCLTIKISSKLLFNALNKEPDKSSVTAAYVAGAIDGDGWVDHRAIQFGQSHVPELFDEISDFFKKLNVHVGTWTKGDEPNYRRMYIPFSVLESTGILVHSIKAQRILRRTVTVKPPLLCTDKEFESFHRLLVTGGEVEECGLEKGVRRAKLLAFNYENEKLVGIASIKSPAENYKRSIFQKTRTNEEPENYHLELGYAFTLDGYRGLHVCSGLIKKLIKIYQYQNMYATTKTTNDRMQAILRRNGFQKTGEPYIGKLHNSGGDRYFLQLFVRIGFYDFFV